MAVETKWSVKDECLKNKRLYLKICGISVLVSIIYSISLPREYDARMKASVENNIMSLNVGDNFASKINYDKSFLGSDPNIYKDILRAPGFLYEIGKIKVKTNDKKIVTDFATYLLKYSEKPWWSVFQKDDDILSQIKNCVKCEVNIKTKLITIQVTAQDSYIAACLVDSIAVHLQDFSTRSKTMKAKIDLIYQKKLRRTTGIAYHQALMAYSQYCDAHEGEITSHVNAEKDYLENEMNLAYNNYDKVSQLCKKTEMKLQQVTPGLLSVDKVHVPEYASHPKVLVNMFVSFFYSFIFTTLWILYRRKFNEIKLDGKR